MILSPSGGLVYHARAAFRLYAWAETRRSVSTLVSNWLTKVRPQRLIIFGPSGGYLIDKSVFDGAGAANGRPLELVVAEPDRIASFIFRKRFTKNPIKWHTRSDFLPFTSLDPMAFKNFVEQQQTDRRVAVLFLGLFGQMGLHQSEFKRPKSEASKILRDSLAMLAVPWASLHDLESTFLLSPLVETAEKEIFDTTPKLLGSPQVARITRMNELLQRADSRATKDSPWIDHETEWLGEPRAIIPWMLSQRRLHLLGWCETSFVGTD